MKIGYGRISTTDQDLQHQRNALEKEGCEKIFEDKMSGSKAERPGLEAALSFARPGDVLVVWKLDRLGRSLQDLIQLVNRMEEKQIGLCCITQQLDTTSPGGRLVFHVFGAMAEFERELIRERTASGLAAARARGRRGGRPRKLDAGKIRMVKNLWQNKETSISEICETLSISRSTFYRALEA